LAWGPRSGLSEAFFALRAASKALSHGNSSALSEDHHRLALRLALSKYPSHQGLSKTLDVPDSLHEAANNPRIGRPFLWLASACCSQAGDVFFKTKGQIYSCKSLSIERDWR
jgi:hypothetical protein